MDAHETSLIVETAAEDIVLVAERFSKDTVKEVLDICRVRPNHDPELGQRVRLEVAAYLIDSEVRFYSRWVLGDWHTENDVFSPRSPGTFSVDFLQALLAQCTRGLSDDEARLLRMRAEEYGKLVLSPAADDKKFGRLSLECCEGMFVEKVASLLGLSENTYFGLAGAQMVGLRLIDLSLELGWRKLICRDWVERTYGPLYESRPPNGNSSRSGTSGCVAIIIALAGVLAVLLVWGYL